MKPTRSLPVSMKAMRGAFAVIKKKSAAAINRDIIAETIIEGNRLDADFRSADIFGCSFYHAMLRVCYLLLFAENLAFTILYESVIIELKEYTSFFKFLFFIFDF